MSVIKNDIIGVCFPEQTGPPKTQEIAFLIKLIHLPVFCRKGRFVRLKITEGTYLELCFFHVSWQHADITITHGFFFYCRPSCFSLGN